MHPALQIGRRPGNRNVARAYAVGLRAGTVSAAMLGIAATPVMADPIRSYVYTGRIVQISETAREQFGIDIDIECTGPGGLCPFPGDRVTGSWTYDAGVEADPVIWDNILVYPQSMPLGMTATFGGVSFSNSRFGISIGNDLPQGDPPARIEDSFGSDSAWSPINYDIQRAGVPFEGDMGFGAQDPSAEILDSTSLLDFDPLAFNDAYPGNLLSGVRVGLSAPLPSGAYVVAAGTLEPGTGLHDWRGAQRGVITINNQINFSGTPRGWWSTVNSAAISELGFFDDFEVRFSIDTDPAGTTWVVGLGNSETDPGWTDIEYGLRSSDGKLNVRENGQWRTDGPPLMKGDLIAIRVHDGVIDYRHNDVPVYSSTYIGEPTFYVDTAFRHGAVALSAMVVGERLPGVGGEALAAWLGTEGGVTTSGNRITYTGSPTGWNNTVISPALSTLGYPDNYDVRFVVEGDPQATTWIVGLGTQESGSGWEDVEYGLRCSDGVLNVRENGTWRANGATLADGDLISIHVSNGTIEYRHKGVAFYTSTYEGSPPFYVDTAFRDGAIDLSVSVLTSTGQP